MEASYVKEGIALTQALIDKQLKAEQPLTGTLTFYAIIIFELTSWY